MPKYKDEQGVFSAKLQYAIEHYIDTRDPDRAAALAGMDPAEFRRLMKHSDVKAEIKKKLDFIDIAMAEVRAKARILTADKLDASLVEVLDGVKVPANAKVRAIEVGYKRHGMLVEKSEVSGAGGAPLAFELVRIGGRKSDESPSR